MSLAMGRVAFGGSLNTTTAMLGAVLATPFMGRLALQGSKGWVEIRDRSHPEHITGWDVTSVHRDEAPVTAFYPPHPAVRDNLETFARAALGPDELVKLRPMRRLHEC